jgi:hypothetical protein
MKPVWGLFWVNQQRLCETVSMGAETGNSLMEQPMDPLCKELPGLLLELLYHHNLDDFVQPNSTAFWHFEEPNVNKFHLNNLHIRMIKPRVV